MLKHRDIIFYLRSFHKYQLDKRINPKCDPLQVYLPCDSCTLFAAVWFTIGTIAIERFTFNP